MPSESLYICNRCKQRKNIHNVKFDRWGKLTCVTCLGEVESTEKKEITRPTSPIVHFICVNCRFKFKINKKTQQKQFCPYCGKTNLMQIKKYKDEDDLIREASDPKFDF
tara:strand:+ start:11332 stop:11658 length:327 start_codon:yes stop_codon:yes gene_type:complete